MSKTSLMELALLFLRLGVTAFGGPTAHIAMMREEVVRRRRWLTDDAFLDLVGATNLIPGPNSTELAMHVGWQRRRLAGLVIAGVCFIVPAMLLTGVLAWVYLRYGSLPTFSSVFYGIKPVIVAIIAHAMWSLVPKAARTWTLRVIGLAALVLTFAGVPELVVLFGAGLLVAVAQRALPMTANGLIPFMAVPSMMGSHVSLPSLFFFFLKTGSVLFGSGYVLVAFLRADLVERLRWLTEPQLLDAIAIGQITPGPVFTTATFIGYLLAGPSGAGFATLGIFLPAFVFVAITAPFLPKLRSSKLLSAFLDGLNVASLALMAVATLRIAASVVIDVPSAAICLCALVILVASRVNPTWLIVVAGISGWALAQKY